MAEPMHTSPRRHDPRARAPACGRTRPHGRLLRCAPIGLRELGRSGVGGAARHGRRHRPGRAGGRPVGAGPPRPLHRALPPGDPGARPGPTWRWRCAGCSTRGGSSPAPPTTWSARRSTSRTPRATASRSTATARARSGAATRSGELEMATLPMDVDGVIAAASAGTPDEGMPDGTVMGHVHLQVADVPEAERHYAGGLGFDVTVRGYPGALFVSAGGYHHHLGLNTWGTRGAPPPPPGARGLVRLPRGRADRRRPACGGRPPGRRRGGRRAARRRPGDRGPLRQPRARGGGVGNDGGRGGVEARRGRTRPRRDGGTRRHRRHARRFELPARPRVVPRAAPPPGHVRGPGAAPPDRHGRRPDRDDRRGRGDRAAGRGRDPGGREGGLPRDDRRGRPAAGRAPAAGDARRARARRGALELRQAGRGGATTSTCSTPAP